MIKDFALLDMRLEKSFERLLINCRFNMVRVKTASFEDFAQAVPLFVFKTVEVFL